ncbi:SDR family oxidoreductase [Lysinibacillus fusiformis]|nr:SDR family oxidoreductase [Lysinibacillus fusiformis]
MNGMMIDQDFNTSNSVELGKLGITVNFVATGPNQTGCVDKQLKDEVLPLIPTGKLIQPQDITNTVRFLCSEEASQITEQVIKVSGGHNL